MRAAARLGALASHLPAPPVFETAPVLTPPPTCFPPAGKGGPGGDAAARRAAEALLCVLSIAEGVLSQLKHCEAGTQGELLVSSGSW